MSATDIRRERMAQQEEQWTKQRREVRRNGTQTWKTKRKGRDGKSNRGKDRGNTQQWEEGREAAEESKGSE